MNALFTSFVQEERNVSAEFYNSTLNSTVGNVNYTNPPTPEFPRNIMITATIFYALIFLFGILGNMLVISVVCFNRNMKTSVNMYLLNLCVADILVLAICMPTALADIYTKTAWHFGEAMCKSSLSRGTELPTRLHVRPTETQRSLRGCTI